MLMYVCTTIFFGSTLLFWYLVIDAVSKNHTGIKKYLYSMIGRTRHNGYGKQSHQNAYSHPWMNRWHLRYIEKTNIRKYMPFFKLTHLLSLEMVLPGVVFVVVCLKTGSILSALPPSLLTATVPLMALDFLAGYNIEKTQRDLASFVSILARWSSVKNDIFFAFEKALESGLNEPLHTFVKEFNVQVKCGINPLDALEHFSNRLGDAECRDVLMNIRQTVRFRGDGNALLTNMESRLYRIQEERNKRKISTMGDRIMILCTIAGVLGFALYFLGTNKKMADFYFKVPTGRMLLFVLCLLFLAGIVLFMQITKPKEE